MDYTKEFKIAEIIASEILGTATEKQEELLSAWLAESEDNSGLYRKITESKTIASALGKRQEIDIRKITDDIRSRIRPVGNRVGAGVRRRKILRIVATAAIMAVVCSSAFLFVRHGGEDEIVIANAPSSSRVKMLLADGREIIIDSIGDRFSTPGGTISKKDGVLVVSGSNSDSDSDSPADEAKRINKIITGFGGEFYFMLSDGTQVWLNADSELSFPFTFGKGGRRVSLSGEAFFKVAHNEQVPFVVIADRMDIRVLGTNFNVKAYANEPTVTATLVSGRIELDTEGEVTELRAGFEGRLDRGSNKITVREADTDMVMAWMGGDFIFNDESLDAVLRTLTRWYGIEFVHGKKFDPRHHIFSGRICKHDSLDETLERINIAGGPVFRIDKDKVFIK